MIETKISGGKNVGVYTLKSWYIFPTNLLVKTVILLVKSKTTVKAVLTASLRCRELTANIRGATDLATIFSRQQVEATVDAIVGGTINHVTITCHYPKTMKSMHSGKKDEKHIILYLFIARSKLISESYYYVYVLQQTFLINRHFLIYESKTKINLCRPVHAPFSSHLRLINQFNNAGIA